MPLDAPVASFNDGTYAIGTQPYRFVSWRAKDSMVLEAIPDHWSGPPAWEKVTFTEISND
ncbi:MAG: ABC transporter substrate-binding protein, partial [Anaerolineales bacterium]|nr:ABC transporter substrate-binding protein [Anaerolineales bacterium]